MNYLEKIRKELSSGDAKFSSDTLLTAILLVVISLSLFFVLINSTYNWISYNFNRIGIVSISGGLIISSALYWGRKVGNPAIAIKALLLDFDFKRYSVVKTAGVAFFFCHWIFWSSLIWLCYSRFFDSTYKFMYAIVCIFILFLARIFLESAIALQRIVENTNQND